MTDLTAVGKLYEAVDSLMLDHGMSKADIVGMTSSYCVRLQRKFSPTPFDDLDDITIEDRGQG